jgi:hypothetical protein
MWYCVQVIPDGNWTSARQAGHDAPAEAEDLQIVMIVNFCTFNVLLLLLWNRHPSSSLLEPSQQLPGLLSSCLSHHHTRFACGTLAPDSLVKRPHTQHAPSARRPYLEIWHVGPHRYKVELTSQRSRYHSDGI